jgi:hypothetical protein
VELVAQPAISPKEVGRFSLWQKEKATVLKVKGLGGEQSAKERGRASRR